MTILDARDVTPEEREAIADEPRCGVWVEEHEVFQKVEVNPLSRRTGKPVKIKSTTEVHGDGRALTQHETDRLIAFELRTWAWRSEIPTAECVQIEELASPSANVWFGEVAPHQQRGGIHSEPLVRLLAYRAWGDRDRVWFVELTARDFMRVVDYVQPGDKITLRGHFGLDHRVRTKRINGGAEGMTMRLECACGDTVWLRPSGRLDAVETEVCRINARL